MAPYDSAQNRLSQVLNNLDTSPRTIGTLTLGAVTYEVPMSESPSRLPRLKQLLELQDGMNAENLYFMLQKYLLGQDIFILSQPGPYARRLAMTFARYIDHYQTDEYESSLFPHLG
jgi:von Willebrand factor A domain-containing protein 8